MYIYIEREMMIDIYASRPFDDFRMQINQEKMDDPRTNNPSNLPFQGNFTLSQIGACQVISRNWDGLLWVYGLPH
jgi:hypothetical protein